MIAAYSGFLLALCGLAAASRPLDFISQLAGSSLADVTPIPLSPFHISAVDDQFRPVSAIRSNRDVKIFFSSHADFAAQLLCQYVDLAQSLVLSTKGNLSALGETGWMLQCEHPGMNFSEVLFSSGATPVSMISITEAPYSDEGGAAVCAVCLPGTCADIQPWVEATLQAGFSDVYLYYTSLLDEANENPQPFVSLPNSRVHYFETDLPAEDMAAAQQLLLTECLHRNKHRHRYLAMAPADSYLSRRAHDAAAGAEESDSSLTSFFDRVLPNNSASIVFEHDYSTADCRPAAVRGSGHSSVVASARAVAFGLNTVATAEPGFKTAVSKGPNTAVWKHLGQCTEQVAQDKPNTAPSDLGSALWDWSWLTSRGEDC